MLLAVYTVSMFLGAALLFLVEPMIAKLLLPLIGGTPAVWNTCLVFFQAMLLAGYLYAYAALRWLGRRTQIAIHVGLVVLPLLLAGIQPFHPPAGWQPPARSTPVGWVLGVLLAMVGLPFFVLASTTPMLQRWFGNSGHRQAADPYFLYAASNVGSLAGLLAYPVLVEPLLGLNEQGRWWRWGYAAFVPLTVACAVLAWQRGVDRQRASIESEGRATAGHWRERLLWVALAFVPSSLMIGATTALTTDVPAIPLFWVLPLALYLISFVLVFARRRWISEAWWSRREPFFILAALAPVVSRAKLPLGVLLAVYLLGLFAVAMGCHGALARERPTVGRLTEFYLWISVGGVLGGVFNSLLAPVLFRSIVEFPLVLLAAAWLRPGVQAEPLAARRNDWLLPAALAAAMLAAIAATVYLGIKPSRLLNILLFGGAMMWCLSFGRRPLRFALGTTALVAAGALYPGQFGRVLYAERSFFGVSRVTSGLDGGMDGRFRYLFHGETIHGVQSLDTERSLEPLAYFTASGPVGDIVRAARTGTARSAWAIVGLGAGAMACHLRAGERLTYYEIDPTVARIAADPRYFTFLSACAPNARIVLGDARLKLADAPDGQYGLIVLDAFSGDTIPMHLVTREAVALYLRKLAPGGILAFHITNLYLQLAPTLASLARDARLVDAIRADTAVPEQEIARGRYPSTWLVMARNKTDLAGLGGPSSHWVEVEPQPGDRVWTDDYSNLVSTIKWR